MEDMLLMSSTHDYSWFKVKEIVAKGCGESSSSVWQANKETSGLSMRGAQIVVCESFNSNVTFIYKGKKMKYKTFRKKEKQLSPQDAKTLNRIVDQIIIEQDSSLGYKHSVDIFSNNYEQTEEMPNET